MDGASKRALSYVGLALLAGWTSGCLDSEIPAKKNIKHTSMSTVVPKDTAAPRAEGKVNILSLATAGVSPANAPWNAQDTDVVNIAKAGVPSDGFSIQAVTETVSPCQGGGTRTTTVDNQAPPWFSQGDVYTTTYVNCAQGGETINGARSFSVDSMTGQQFIDPIWSVATTMATRNMVRVSTATGNTASADGSATTIMSAVDNAYSQASKGQWTRTHPNNGAQQQWSATFDVVYAWDETAQTYTWDFNVSTASSLFGNTTAQSIVQLAGAINQAPDTGKLKITQNPSGTTTSITMITAQGSGNALVEVDSNGDGTFESSTIQQWSDLMIDPILYQFF